MTDDLRQHLAIQGWAKSTVGESEVIPVVCTAFDADMLVHTLEGTMRAGLGDYIIRGVRGEFYPVKEAIFQETYEEARDEE